MIYNSKTLISLFLLLNVCGVKGATSQSPAQDDDQAIKNWIENNIVPPQTLQRDLTWDEICELHNKKRIPDVGRPELTDNNEWENIKKQGYYKNLTQKQYSVNQVLNKIGTYYGKQAGFLKNVLRLRVYMLWLKIRGKPVVPGWVYKLNDKGVYKLASQRDQLLNHYKTSATSAR